MTNITILVIALALSMDSFAVALVCGLKSERLDLRLVVKVAATFAIFQAVMPAIGWLLAFHFSEMIADYDHWIAFLMLSVLGGKMIWSGVKESETAIGDPHRWRTLFTLAFATSIDALAVGLSFALLQVSILKPLMVIFAMTFICTITGLFIGHFFGRCFSRYANILGGLILVAIGVNILLTHLGLI